MIGSCRVAPVGTEALGTVEASGTAPRPCVDRVRSGAVGQGRRAEARAAERGTSAAEHVAASLEAPTTGATAPVETGRGGRVPGAQGEAASRPGSEGVQPPPSIRPTALSAQAVTLGGLLHVRGSCSLRACLGVYPQAGVEDGGEGCRPRECRECFGLGSAAG